MRRFSRAAANRALRLIYRVWATCCALAFLTACMLTACTAPRQFGRTSTAPSTISGSPTFASHAPATGRRFRPTPAPSLAPDETQVGAPWSGLQLAAAPSVQGIFVGLVARDSPAASSGIQAGDFIFQLDGRPVSDAQEILSEVERVGVNGSLRLGVRRGTQVRLFRVEPIARPAAAPTEELSAQTTATAQSSAKLEQNRSGE